MRVPLVTGAPAPGTEVVPCPGCREQCRKERGLQLALQTGVVVFSGQVPGSGRVGCTEVLLWRFESPPQSLLQWPHRSAAGGDTS